MSEEQNQTQDTQNVLEQGDVSVEPTQAPDQGTPTLEELRTQIAERDRQIQEMGTKYATLEKIVTENRQPQSQPQPQAQVDYGSMLKRSLEKAYEGNTEEASREMQELIARSNQNVASSLGNQFKAYLEIQKEIGEVIEKKPHLKGFKQDYEFRINQYLQAGNDVKTALDAVEKEFDNKFQGLVGETKQQGNEMKTDQQRNVNGSIMGNVGQQPPPPPQVAPKVMSPEEYIAHRQKKQAGMYFNTRDNRR